MGTVKESPSSDSFCKDCKTIFFNYLVDNSTPQKFSVLAPSKCTKQYREWVKFIIALDYTSWPTGVS